MPKNDVGKYDGWTCSAIVFFHVPCFLHPMEAWQNGENKQTHKIANREQKPLSWYLVFWKYLGGFQFLVAGRNQQKNICFTNLYIYIYIYRRYFWPYYYTANVAPHRCMVAPHRCMIVYRSIRGHCFFLIPHLVCLTSLVFFWSLMNEIGNETLKKLSRNSHECLLFFPTIFLALLLYS